MRDRLIKLLDEAINKSTNYSDVARYLLEGGVIAPPCRVGQTVYSYLHSWKKEDGIAPYQITNLTITQNKKGIWTKKYRAMKVVDGKTIDWQLNFAFDDIGKTVFFTQEEAEQALIKAEAPSSDLRLTTLARRFSSPKEKPNKC